MASLLEQINSPADLRRLPPSALPRLADEIRAELLRIIPQTGGHLASNLGSVELTIALHRVYQSPRDKIVWDVGHQGYVHKLLTGRRDRFHTIRQEGGLAGFLVREESEHDVFGAGHAGTSISAALGMAIARDLSGQQYHVVAVIGDGSLTAGMAMEALNHAGELGTRLTIVLNDNGMSIAPNVGAYSRLFDRLRMDPRYRRAKQEAHAIAEHVPLGPQAWEVGRRLKRGVQQVLDLRRFWEELGFASLGPIDGHNIHELERALRWARARTDKPVVLHVVTVKGKGYLPAEADAVKWHGVAPGGGAKGAGDGPPTYTQVFARTLARCMEQDPRVVAITAAMPDGTGLSAVARQFPKRVFDVGIAEQHAVTLAAGLATQGFLPVAAIYSTFLQRAYDQVVHDVCVQRLPVVFAIDRAGIVGDDGRTHQGLYDIAYLRCLPHMTIAAPRDEDELQHLLFTALRHAAAGRGPIAVRYPRGAGLGVPLAGELRELPIGLGEVLCPGSGAAILALGTMVAPALEAADLLAAEGIQCAVADARFAKPLDEELILRLAAAAPVLVTAEEHALAGGFGSAVLEVLASRGAGAVVERVGVPDLLVDHAPQRAARARLGLDAAGIAARVRAGLQRAAGRARVAPPSA